MLLALDEADDPVHFDCVEDDYVDGGDTVFLQEVETLFGDYQCSRALFAREVFVDYRRQKQS